MRNITIFQTTVLFVLSINSLKSQINDIGVWGGYSIVDAKYNSFEQFLASYSDYTGAKLKNDSPTLRIGNSFSGGIELHTKVFYGELFANKAQASTDAVFSNKEKRHFEVNHKNISCGMGFGYAWDLFYVYAIGAMSSGEVLIKNSFIYNDGTESFGFDKVLNSNSQGIFMGGYYGIIAGFPLAKNHFRLMVRACHFGSYSQSPLHDIFGSSNNPLTSAVPHPDGIPTDYGSYIENGYDYTGSYVKNDLRLWQFSIALNYQFKLEKEE